MSGAGEMSLGWTGRVMRMLDAVCTLVLVNLLILLGTLVGLGVLGAMPSAAAGAVVLLRDAERRERDGGALRLFVRVYRAEFVRSNVTGLPFVAVGLLAVADLSVLPLLAAPVAAAIGALTVIVGIISALAALFIAVLLARYDDPPRAVRRYALSAVLASPLTAVGVLIALAGCVVIALAAPVGIPLIGAAAPLAVAARLIDRRLIQLDPQPAA